MLNRKVFLSPSERNAAALKRWPDSLAAFAGLFGAWGVGAAALAAHGEGGRDLSIAARFLMLHAAAIAAIAAPRPEVRAPYLVSASLLALGVLLFCGDLSSRALLGSRLFPMAAPSGGMLLIAGWLALTVAAALSLSRGPR